MKYSQWIGIGAAILLVISCFIPWAFYPDLNKSFTGFFSENNNYGKPGKVFVVMAVVAIVFFLVPRVWAKRWNLLVGALTLAYAIKSFIVFTGCYKGICPTKLAGIWVMLVSAAGLLVMTLLPDMKVIENKK
ncbi:hypothetical protein [Paraflavitalea sp. CAU 1676]|uniref:hypothetical protein n=1 Tax=Paraflavitalea sp. CAU 1676 TaxID=3032598 RepID=UPI0023DCE74C|nr:hypothetical protein [Paraflavitalea sp. CAU 1676]MDF2191434.1 hypothetical protein [Paraflavitalea sp. CAU 1676]